MRVDSLNTGAHNLQLRETMRRSEEELNNKDRLIEKYQNEIKQRGDEIEKKVPRRASVAYRPEGGMVGAIIALRKGAPMNDKDYFD